MGAKPRLADVHCTRIHFEPGDRVLVETFHDLTKEERRRLERGVQRWAGPDVEVLIYDASKMKITIDKGEPGLIKP